jgi:hypothetical protein
VSSTRSTYSSQRAASAVARSQNVLAWTCHSSPYDNFTVLYVFLHPNKPRPNELTNFTRIANPSTPTVLPAPLAIIGIEQNYQCSQEITQDMAKQPPGTGYLILFANPLNSSDVSFSQHLPHSGFHRWLVQVYATSKPFEIKALGSTYPPASATPRESGYETTSASATGAAASQSHRASGAALPFKASAGYCIAAAAALLGLLTA